MCIDKGKQAVLFEDCYRYINMSHINGTRRWQKQFGSYILIEIETLLYDLTFYYFKIGKVSNLSSAICFNPRMPEVITKIGLAM